MVEVAGDSAVDAPLVLGIDIPHADKPLTIHPHEFVDLTTGRSNFSSPRSNPGGNRVIIRRDCRIPIMSA
jgi:hypothetical protein